MKPKPIQLLQNEVRVSDAAETPVLEPKETLVDSAPIVQGRKGEEFISQPSEKLPVAGVSVKPPPGETKMQASQSSKASANGV
ncbi:LETM1 domain-containing protein LETM2, mitochondrial-like [Terrapene carolina triunguis]|uniref:LETM1 domain-containing protein LETM2, mitochondrial-like n=1 Tax=Terrapene triunguis TaxID=2587831 RepID=UPI000E7751F7|nr:LETM1 domain-containing protein LETM2, mitochondrial-like [Terrapene carolina triunguis]